MKNRNTRIIMGILVGLVLFSSSVALLLYLRQQSTDSKKEQNIAIYVAAKHLHKGDYIDADAITKANIPRSYVNFTPLMPSEIIGKYAKTEIFAKEPLRPEKLVSKKPLIDTVEKMNTTQVSAAIPKDVNATKEQEKSDTIAIPLSVFKNRDSSLHSGSFVDIMSVNPKIIKGKEWSFKTNYIALHVPIDHFVSKNIPIDTFTYTVSKQVNKQTINKTLEADTIILSMTPKDLKNFLATYYKTQKLDESRVYNTHNYGGQLWMVNAAGSNEELQKEKEKMMIDKKHIYKKKKTRHKVSITYEK